MKKIYKAPATDVQKLELQNFAAAFSTDLHDDDTVENPDDVGGNEGSSLWDDED